jgi:uncharacterized membrane protein
MNQPLAAQAPARARLDSVDLLRGLVMIIMALDHVRDFFSSVQFDPTDLAKTTAPLFMTRWVTHFCAPVFCFLAGTGAFLSKRPLAEQRRFLFSRGLFLVVLELTVVHVGFFGPQYRFVPLITIWALGWSMVALGVLLYLPRAGVTAVGLAIIFLHNLLDAHHGGGLFRILHEPGPLEVPGPAKVFVGYPILPWIGVMACGYAFGPVLRSPHRRRWLFGLGSSAIALFVLMRLLNGYGDPQPWAGQPRAIFTLFSFVNTTKYPPSIDYLLMTLGPSLLALWALDSVRAGPRNPVLIFGRVPMFYYIAHLYLLQATQLAMMLLVFGHAPQTFNPRAPHEAGGGFGLVTVYAVWILAVAALYPACRWYAGLKQRSRHPLLSYI